MSEELYDGAIVVILLAQVGPNLTSMKSRDDTIVVNIGRGICGSSEVRGQQSLAEVILRPGNQLRIPCALILIGNEAVDPFHAGLRHVSGSVDLS